MPKPYPREFRDDVVRVAREREPGVTLEQVAVDFGIHPATLTKWMSQARSGRVRIPSGSSGGSGEDAGSRAELRAAQRRIKLLEQENEVLRRAAAYLSQASLPGK